LTPQHKTRVHPARLFKIKNHKKSGSNSNLPKTASARRMDFKHITGQHVGLTNMA
jgi:hypothetical protein